MSDHNQNIKAFTLLGEFITEHFQLQEEPKQAGKYSGMHKILNDSIEQSLEHNPWFTKKHIEHAIQAIGQMLTEQNLNLWLNQYQIIEPSEERRIRIGVIMAGNIPAVGFHDFLCVLMSGANFTGKLSSDDPYLLPALAKILSAIDNSFEDRIEFTSEPIANATAIIATGSNNTLRYFEYHYSSLPHIFRNNRNGLAVLFGNETQDQLDALAKDVFLYFGLGCRNISKLLVPVGYNFSNLIKAFEASSYVKEHEPYMNNYKHNMALYNLQQGVFLDNGFLILKNSTAIASPVATLNYEFYESLDELVQNLEECQDQIQCIVSEMKLPFATIAFGQTQQPGLEDYADGVDTIKFIADLKS
ncbi:MAG: acyl-CoA reductase [Bacteroidales bacterium]|nr:acyl-CoA reductase [Bacteroidales bacterium]